MNRINKKLKQKKFLDYKNFFLIFLGLFFLLLLFYSGFDFFNKISGKSILNIEASYQEGQPLEGSLTLSLKQGELIPFSSKIVIANDGMEEEYVLHELVSNNVVEGDFYVEGKEIEGFGKGYGVSGVKEIYPVVYFKLNIFSEVEDAEDRPTGESEVEVKEDKTKIGFEKEVEEPEEKIIEEKVVEEEQEKIEEEAIEEEEKIIEEEAENEEVEDELENEVAKSEVADAEDEPASESEVADEIIKEEAEEPEVEEEQEEVEEEISSITGKMIARFGRFFNFFLELTGRVSMEIETEIEGEVSKDKPFVYNLREAQKAEIISSSKDVEMSIKENDIVVTTDYVEYEEGFGEEYVGADYADELVVDLSKLNFIANKPEMAVSLVYGSEEIISLTVDLDEGLVSKKEIKKQNNETVLKKDLANETVLNESIIKVLPGALSDEEKQVLINKFGNVSMEMTKAEVFNERLILKYELGSLWIEYSYDYPGKINEKLASQIEEDKIKWLRDLADRFSQDETGSEEIVNMTKKINIF